MNSAPERSPSLRPVARRRQAVMAAAAIGLNLLRAIRRPALRKTVIAALVIAAACAAVGTLTDRTSLCRVGDLVQGHAV